MRYVIISLGLALLLALALVACSANKKEAPPISSDQQHIKNVVEARKQVLQKIYLKHYNYKPQSGTLKIKIFITDQGLVQNAELTIDKGGFTPEFMAEIKSNVLTWKFVIDEPTIYTFKTLFSKK